MTYNVEQYKQDARDGYYCLDEDIRDGNLNVSIYSERDKILVTAEDTEDGAMYAGAISTVEFMEMDSADFNRFVCNVYYYGAIN